MAVNLGNRFDETGHGDEFSVNTKLWVQFHMKRLLVNGMKLSVLFTLLLGVQLGACAATIAADKAGGSWNLDQYCQPWGRVQFIAGQSGAKLVSQKLNVLMSPTAPTRAFNPQRSIYCDLSQGSSRSKLSFATTPGQAVKGGSGTVLNYKATQYWCGGFNNAGKMVFTNEFWVTNDLRIPAFANDKYSKMCGLPPGLGTPLKIIRHYGDVRDPNHKQSVFLETYKASPFVITTAMLTPPTGYRKADEVEVIMGDELDELSALTGRKR